MAEAAFAQTPPIFNVRNYGAVGDGTNIDSVAINAAIAAAGAAGGGTVTFPPGNYLSLSIHLTNNLTLYLSNNAVILAAATNGFDAAESNPYSQYQDYGHSHFHDSLIWGENLFNVGFAGPGEINGNGNLIQGNPGAGYADKAIALVMCSNVSINGITITAAGHFGILADACTNMLVVNAQILNAYANQHRDAFNLVDSSDVVISNCVIQGSDDAMVLKSDYALGRKIGGVKIHILNCQILSTENNATQFGSETVGNFSDVTWSNLVLTASGKAGIGITSQDGSIIDGVTYDNIIMSNCPCPIFLKLDYRTTDTPSPAVGAIRNISINNVTAVHSTFYTRTNTSTINGFFTDSMGEVPIENITFNNVNVSDIGRDLATSITNYPVENQDWQPQNFGRWPSYGWYLRYARNISFTNCQVHFDINDDRPAVMADTVTNVLFNNFVADVGQRNANYDMGFLNVSNYDVMNAVASATAPSPGAALRIYGSNATSAVIVSPPYFTPGDGIYSMTQSVVIASGTPGAAIRYTTDGTTPTSTSGTIYSQAATVGSETVLRAIAYASGMVDSAVNVAIYEFPRIALDFGLSATPSGQLVNPGSNAVYTVTLATNSGFSGGVTLGLSGLPSGASANFAPAILSNAAASTLTITTSNAQNGDYPLAIFGTNGNGVASTAVSLIIGSPAANPGLLTWTGGGGDLNWSTPFNWTNPAAGGNGPPGPANNLQFSNAAAASSPGTPNNVANGDFTVGALQYENNAANTAPNYQATMINGGEVLVVTNGLIVGTQTDAGANQAVNAVVTGANGTLVLSNGIFAVTQGSGSDGAHQAVLDLSGLGTLDVAGVSRIGVAVNQFPAQSGNGGQRSSGILYLARSNYIAVTSLGVTNGILVGWNDNTGNGSSNGIPIPGDKGSALYLGQTNVVFTDAVYVGTDKTLGCLLAFNPNGLNQPTAYFRGVGGSGSRVSFWGIGDTSMKSGSNQSCSGTNDFGGGSVDALVGNMTVGVSQTGNSGGNTGNGTGVLTLQTGTVDVNNLTNGWSVGSGGGSTDLGIGTVNVNGAATLRVHQNLALAQNTGSGSGTPSGTLNLNGGIVQASSIIGGKGVSTINLNSGVLDLQYTNPAPGQIGNVSALNIGANGAGAAALLTNAANISASNTIVIAANGALAGNTVITAPSLIVNGTLSPGANHAGWMTNNGPVTLGAGGACLVTVQDATAGPVAGWSYLQVTGGISIQSSSGAPFIVAVQTAANPAANFSYGTNYNWMIAAAIQGITNFGPSEFSVADSLFANDLAGGYFYLQTNASSLLLCFTNNHPPFAAQSTWYRTNGALTIPLSLLATNWSDPDGDPVALVSVNTNSANGQNSVSTDGTNIYYVSANPVPDAITYVVQDVRNHPPAVYRQGDTVQTAVGEVNVLFLNAPQITTITIIGADVILNGVNGPAGGPYSVLLSTNVALPLSNWSVIGANSFDSQGNFNFTNAFNPLYPFSFYAIEALSP